MALKKTVTLSGVLLTDAYHMVLTVGSGSENILAIRLGTFKSSTEADAWKAAPRTADQPIKVWPYTLKTFAKGGANVHTQAYTHLKTLDEWSGATDV